MKELAIIILDWNGADDTIECIEGLKNHSLYDIYLLDNGSNVDNSEKILAHFSGQRVNEYTIQSFEKCKSAISYIHSDENLGFAIGNNRIAQSICDNYKYILLLNNDTIVPCGTIEKMIDTAVEKKTTALTCEIREYFNKTKLWNAGGYFTVFGERKYYSQRKIESLKNKNIDYIDAPFITGCAMLVDAKYISENGLFSDKFFHGEEDFNFCYKLAQKKMRVGVDLSVALYHKVGKSISRAIGTEVNYNSMVINYSNRVIDFKEFYGPVRWKIWRFIYLSFVFFRRTMKGMKPTTAFELCKRIYQISDNCDDVKKATFDKVMSMRW